MRPSGNDNIEFDFPLQFKNQINEFIVESKFDGKIGEVLEEIQKNIK